MKMNFHEVGCDDVDWFGLDQVIEYWNFLLTMVNKHSGSVKGGKFLNSLKGCQRLSMYFVVWR
jgi:hypothetical protein